MPYTPPAYGDYGRQKADADNVLVWKIASNGRVPVFRLDMGGHGFLESVLAGRIGSPTPSITGSPWMIWKVRSSGTSPVETLLASIQNTSVSGASRTTSRTSSAMGPTRRPVRRTARRGTSTRRRTHTPTRALGGSAACAEPAIESVSAPVERGE